VLNADRFLHLRCSRRQTREAEFEVRSRKPRRSACRIRFSVTTGYLIEIDPKYVDVTIERYQKLTGKPALLESSGHTYEQTKGERAMGGWQ